VSPFGGLNSSREVDIKGAMRDWVRSGMSTTICIIVLTVNVYYRSTTLAGLQRVQNISVISELIQVDARGGWSAEQGEAETI
jgi:hypothetical protein